MNADGLLSPGGRAREWSGWRGVVLIAATYVYFLIFAQFGFLKQLDELGIGGSSLKAVMAAMAVGGIASSLLAPRVGVAASDPVFRLRCGLGGCALAAVLAVLPLTVPGAVAVACLIGVSLGLVTVTLVSHLRLWTGMSRPLMRVGLGTGAGYFLCNVPAVFTASPRVIAVTAAAVCVAAILAASADESREQIPALAGLRGGVQPTFVLVLTWFAALIWLDSAAFFIIQDSPALKSGTWEGAGHLWRTGTLHLAAALGGASLIARRGLSTTLLVAFASLATACLVLHYGESAWMAAFLYPVGVSVYSVALVAAPSFLLQTASVVERARQAGWIYAVAGWVGSAMGIGMAQNLHRVPPAFVLAAAVVFLVPWSRGLRREQLPRIAAVLLSLGVGFALQRVLTGGAAGRTQTASQGLVERGRRVYISEGCIHCHSQYVRPHSPDVLLWGPTQDVEAIRREQPPLIGNRRQGPDLSEVGSRRSPLWLRVHFMNPRDLSYESVMPAYAHLFRDERGEALLAYVESLKTAGSDQHLLQAVSSWTPGVVPAMGNDAEEGQRLFGHYCATCHAPGGKVRQKWAASFRRLPPYFGVDDLVDVAPSASLSVRELRIARIIKFGIPGTDMPGHEYLPDAEVEALAAWVSGRTMYYRQR